MNSDDPLSKNIRRTTGIHALKQIRTLVDEENANDAFKATVLRWLLRYGWLVLLFMAVLLARLLGVI